MSCVSPPGTLHLNDTGGEGWLPRTGPGYDALAGQVVALAADIAAFQEVEDTAARRVSPALHWHVERSTRPIQEPGRACWDRPEARFGHVATGLAIHLGVAYRRNDDLKSLGEGDASQGWATDITLTGGGRDLRLLAVHLKTGCWGAGEDRDGRREEACAVLHSQTMHMKDWGGVRRAEGTAFVVLGDFNRRLIVPRRLGEGTALSAVGTAASGALGPCHTVRSPVHGADRPPGTGRGRAGHAGGELDPRVAAPRAPPRSLRRAGRIHVGRGLRRNRRAAVRRWTGRRWINRGRGSEVRWQAGFAPSPGHHREASYLLIVSILSVTSAMMPLRPALEGLPRRVEWQSCPELREVVSCVPGKFHPVSVKKGALERGQKINHRKT